MKPYNKISKSDNWNTRHAKRQLRARLKSKAKKWHSSYNGFVKNLEQNHQETTHHHLRLSEEIQNFYKINQNKIWKSKSDTIDLTKDFTLYDSPERVLGTILDILYRAKTNQEYVTLNYKSGVGFGALYFIDTICWEIARSKKWTLNLHQLPLAEQEMLVNLKSFRTSKSDNEYTYIVHSKIKINRADDKLAKQEHREKSKEIRDLIERGLAESNNNANLELSIDQHTALDSAISEHFDNILLHAPEANYGFLCGLYNKYEKSACILIYNFGPTIFDTLNNNKLPDDVKAFKDNVIHNHSQNKYFIVKSKFNEENALTLLALQEGISSVLSADKSRGHGLIDFIEHCFELNNETKITMISGNTAIKIDKKFSISYKNVMGRQRRMIALNEQNDIFSKPDENYVRNMRFKFPGVMILTKIPLKS